MCLPWFIYVNCIKVRIQSHNINCPKFKVRREGHFFFPPSSNFSKSLLPAEMDVSDSHSQKSSPHSILDAEKVEKKPGGWRAVTFILGMCFSLVRERNLFVDNLFLDPSSIYMKLVSIFGHKTSRNHWIHYYTYYPWQMFQTHFLPRSLNVIDTRQKRKWRMIFSTGQE